jgi:DNA-binding LytR/AlgR family response regulator
MTGTYITVRIKGRRFTIDPGEIVFIKAEGCYSRLFTDNYKDGIYISKPLSILKVELSSFGFLQCHRSFLVNSHRINGFDSKKKSIKVEMYVIQVSKRNAVHIFRYLSRMGIPDMDLTVST